MNTNTHQIPTPNNALSQWQDLVKEAEEIASLHLPEEIESYLVFLLMRFVVKPEIVKSILAMEFLESLNQMQKIRQMNLQAVADKCLLFAGLFPGRAEKRRVKISYFVKLGQTAYSSLSAYENRSKALASLYYHLSEQFVAMMDILHNMRDRDRTLASLDLLQAEELYREVKSSYALDVLQRKTQGFTIIGQNANNSSNTSKH